MLILMFQYTKVNQINTRNIKIRLVHSSFYMNFNFAQNLTEKRKRLHVKVMSRKYCVAFVIEILSGELFRSNGWYHISQGKRFQGARNSCILVRRFVIACACDFYYKWQESATATILPVILPPNT